MSLTDAQYELLGKLTEADETIARLERELRGDVEAVIAHLQKERTEFWTGDSIDLEQPLLDLVAKVEDLQATRVTAESLRAQLYPQTDPVQPGTI